MNPYNHRMGDHNLPAKTSQCSEVRLPSGRSLRIESASGGEQLEILSPDGLLELRIAMTPQGPVLSLSGAKLELNATESVSLNCGRLEVNSTNGIAMRSEAAIRIESGGEFGVRAVGDADIDARVINLNCGDRSEYDDPIVTPPQLLTAPSAQQPSHDCGCNH